MMKLTTILLLLLIMPIVPVIAQDENSLAAAQELMDARDYSSAIDAFEQILKNDPNNVEALSGIIRAHIFAENYRNAQRIIDRAIEAHPKNPEFHLRRGILNSIRGQHSRAIEDFDRAIELSSGEEAISPLVNRGNSYMRQEDYVTAMQDFTRALEINPMHSGALGQQGFANYRIGNYHEAIEDFDLALEIDPENAMNYYNRGMSYLRIGNRSKACSDFHQSCSKGNMNACRMIMAECQGGGQ